MINKKRNEVRDFILHQIPEHPNDIATMTSREFGISRQTAVNYLTKLIDEGLLTATGSTRARKYELRTLIKQDFYKKVIPDLAEDELWRNDISPLVKNVPSNVVDICQYGFTEIVRNVFDHSESGSMLYTIIRNAICIELNVYDHGIGIFNKIRRDFNLNDPRHALLELAKGKLTSDPTRHSGEGIFFTSRMFDKFAIYSHPLFYIRQSREDSDWLIDVGESTQKGTLVTMEISPNSKRTTQGVYDQYAPEKDNYGFTRTHVPIELARYEGEQLVSRSQARRLLARIDRFNEALLDFKGVKTIGRAFADEIFRVYHLEHPAVNIIAINTSEDVKKMIRMAETSVSSEQPPLF